MSEVSGTESESPVTERERTALARGSRFLGRVAIVTGASLEPSIGRATARRLAEEGAAIVINARAEAPLREAEEAFRREGFPVLAFQGDAGDEGVAAELVRRAVEEFGRIDAVVSTVGGNRFWGSPRSLSREELQETIDMNTWGPLALGQAAIAGGLGHGGAIVHISSGTVHKTTPKMIAYAAAKSALNAMTRTLAADYAELGIRVNAVAPGFTKTAGTEDLWGPDDGAAASSQLPTGRLTEAVDIANAVVFLLSDEARQITGTVLDVDGGNHLGGGGYTPMAGQTPRG